jgi:acyl-CoA dehydrogenase
MLNTINYCKFNLGFGSIGLSTHAFYEAITHAHNRILYGKPVTIFPHVRRLFTDAWLRLNAMKMFAYRATDYMRSASADDRRYLLFNPMVKMKVTMEGEKVLAALTDIIAAKAYEKEPFFEIAGKEVPMFPKLEGTAHVNMGLINKFMKNYFFDQADMPAIPERMDNADDTYLFNQGPARGLSGIHFTNYESVYEKFDLPNIGIFREQVAGFKRLLTEAAPDKDQMRDTDLMLSVGELFTMIVYGQLILEKAEMVGTSENVLNQTFDVFVRDFSIYASTVYGKAGTSEAQRTILRDLIRAPQVDADQFDQVWNDEVAALSGTY